MKAVAASLGSATSTGVSRRQAAVSAFAGLALIPFVQPAQAGGQLEEPLVDSVRTALSAAVHDMKPPELDFTDTESRLKHLRWKIAMSERLKRKIPQWQERQDFLETVAYKAKRSGLDVALVLGLIQVESNFRKHAVSSVGARGYMQVMPFWLRLLAVPGEKEDVGKLFDGQVNLRFGCVILRHYLDREKGDLFMALGRYNGSRGKAPYPNAVLGAKKAWEHMPA